VAAVDDDDGGVWIEIIGARFFAADCAVAGWDNRLAIHALQRNSLHHRYQLSHNGQTCLLFPPHVDVTRGTWNRTLAELAALIATLPPLDADRTAQP
jgi:hypothetical protein